MSQWFIILHVCCLIFRLRISKKVVFLIKFLIMKLTALIEKSEDGWFVGQLEEFPEVLSQGKTVSEVKTNLLDACLLYTSPSPRD